MPVFPPQNTGIFDLKIPGFGPLAAPGGSPGFWLKPTVPYYIDNTSPNKTSFTTATITFTPICAQGATLTFISATCSGGVVTQTGTYSFTVTFTNPHPAISNELVLTQLIVSYSDEDGNVGYGSIPIGGYMTKTGANITHVSGLSAFTAAGTAPAVITSNSETVTTPSGISGSGIGGSPSWEFFTNFASGSANQLYLEEAPTNVAIASYGGATGPPVATSYSFYLDTQGNPPYDAYFEQTIVGVGIVAGQYTSAGTTYCYYTDIVPITFTITGNPYSK